MKLLLDTHAFIWWDSEPARLSSRALALCQDSENKLLLSVASTWEMQIKIQLGKLKLGVPLAELMETQQRVNGLEILRRELRIVPPDLADLLLDSLKSSSAIRMCYNDHDGKKD